MPEDDTNDPEITPQTGFAVLRAALDLNDLLLEHSTEQIRQEMLTFGFGFSYGQDDDYLGPIAEWDGQFFSFPKLAESAEVTPTGHMSFDLYPKEGAVLTLPDTVLRILFLADSLTHGRAVEGTVIGKAIAIGTETPAQVIEIVSDSTQANGVRSSDWRTATEPEGQAALTDVRTMHEKITAYVAEHDEPLLS